MIAAGLCLALIPGSDNSLIVFGDSGPGVSVLSETLVQACAVVAAPLHFSVSEFDIDIAVQPSPLLFLVFPIGGALLAMRIQARRVRSLAPLSRLAWAAASGVPLGLLMLIVALLSKTTGSDSGVEYTLKGEAGPVFLLSTLWGSIGGLAGAVLAARDDLWTWGAARPSFVTYGRPVWRILRAFGLALLLSTIAMTAVVVVQTLRDAGGIQTGRSGAGAVVEDALYAVEHGTHGLELGTFAQFNRPPLRRVAAPASQLSLLSPVPITKTAELFEGDEYRVGSYQDQVPSWLFVLGLVLMVGLVVVFSVYAGFASARVAPTARRWQALAWGAMVGPVWATAVAVLNGLSNKTENYPFFGLGDGGSAFAMTLLFGVGFGVIGAAIASSGPPRAPSRAMTDA